MRKSFRTLAMIAFMALVVVMGFFGPYLLSLLLLGLFGLCWLVPPAREEVGARPRVSSIRPARP
jgi:hypothetical protein